MCGANVILKFIVFSATDDFDAALCREENNNRISVLHMNFVMILNYTVINEMKICKKQSTTIVQVSR